jgi:O-antigen/teichoic acid export membrane protein
VTSSRVLARNTLWNVLGQVLPTLAAAVAIPILIRHLGAARFGVLTLGWAAIGYFGLFDLGLSRALTHAVATRVGLDPEDRELSSVTWTALALMLVMGIVGGAVLAVFTPLIVERGLHVQPTLLVETRTSFYLLALSLPWVVTTAGLRGLLEAHQDFGAATALRVPLALFTFIGPLLVLPFSTSLVPVIAVLVAVRGLTWVAHLLVCLQRYPYLRQAVHVRWSATGPLLRYGGWMTVSNVISPLMAYLDRFVVAAILPLAAVAHYVTPFEIVTRLSVLPLAIVGAHFPAFATTFARDPDRTAVLFVRTLRAILLLMFPVLLVIVLFAGEGLTAWVGADFARASTPVLQWLAAGIFVNSLAQAPFAVLQGTGRPDVTGRLHLAELPVYLASLFWLVHRFGIVGVAIAWTIRATIDAVALLILAERQVPGAARRFRAGALVAALVLVVFWVAALLDTVPAKAIYLVVVLVAFALAGWTQVVDAVERDSLRRWARLALPRWAPR